MNFKISCPSWTKGFIKSMKSKLVRLAYSNMKTSPKEILRKDVLMKFQHGPTSRPGITLIKCYISVIRNTWLG